MGFLGKYLHGIRAPHLGQNPHAPGAVEAPQAANKPQGDGEARFGRDSV